MIQDAHETQALRDEIQQYLEDIEQADHMAAVRSSRQRLEQQLGETLSPDEVTDVMQLRNDCRFYVVQALALCERVEIRDGVVVCVGTRAAEFQRDLARFNVVRSGTKSYAAFCLHQITEDQR